MYCIFQCRIIIKKKFKTKKLEWKVKPLKYHIEFECLLVYNIPSLHSSQPVVQRFVQILMICFGFTIYFLRCSPVLLLSFSVLVSSFSFSPIFILILFFYSCFSVSLLYYSTLLLVLLLLFLYSLFQFLCSFFSISLFCVSISVLSFPLLLLHCSVTLLFDFAPCLFCLFVSLLAFLFPSTVFSVLLLCFSILLLGFSVSLLFFFSFVF